MSILVWPSLVFVLFYFVLFRSVDVQYSLGSDFWFYSLLKSLSLRTAFLETKKVRSCIGPNSGFVRQLVDYEKEIRGENSVSLEGVKSEWDIELGKLTRQNL